jgi:aarF domain-containing kinase
MHFRPFKVVWFYLRRVAVKVQYPGVSKGIESDIKNLLGILKVINILPDGLFMDNIIKHMTIELQQECDYEREAYWCTKMKSMLEPYPQYNVPNVILNLSTKQILTCEYIDGLTIDECAEQLDQKTRNDICLKFVELMLRELFIHRYGCFERITYIMYVSKY